MELQAKTEISNIPINLIRAIGIIQVIVIHAVAETPYFKQLTFGNEWNWLATNIYQSITRSSVPLFVMIGGVLLLQPSKTNETISDFFKKRLSRIVPPFIFWAAVYFAWRSLYCGETFSLNWLWKNIFPGYPYWHFWFLYMLFGLYLITPILRPVVAHSNVKVLKYLVSLSFFGSAVIPLIGLFVTINMNPFLLIFGGWVGYFILGLYLLNLRIKSLILYLIVFFGSILTVVGTWILTVSAGGKTNHFFYDYLSASAILISSAVFLLLCKISPERLEKLFPKGNKLINLIGQNTLAIYLFHVLILKAFREGLIGFRLSFTFNPILEIPLISITTLGICLAIIIPLKKMPILKKLIG